MVTRYDIFKVDYVAPPGEGEPSIKLRKGQHQKIYRRYCFDEHDFAEATEKLRAEGKYVVKIQRIIFSGNRPGLSQSYRVTLIEALDWALKEFKAKGCFTETDEARKYVVDAEVADNINALAERLTFLLETKFERGEKVLGYKPFREVPHGRIPAAPDLPQVIRKLLNKKGCSVKDAAEASGISYGTLNRLKTRRPRALKSETVQKLADYFGVEPERFTEA